MMFGMMGRFLPAAAATVLLSNPVTIGLGALFAGQALLDQRKRRLTTQRQQARTSVRQFVDEVQFEVGNELAEVVRTVQRQLRDEFSDRIGQLQRTYAEAAQQAQQALKHSDAQRRARGDDLFTRLSAIDRLLSAADSLSSAGAA